MNEQTVKIYRNLNDAQHKRVNIDHRASVNINESGKLQYLSESIITPKGIAKENKKLSILPNDNEKVVSIEQSSYLFEELAHMNIILTNACNLNCSYCYEQHNQDFGRFTEESLLKAYDFLLKNSKSNWKQFQFFGGEPLIHKDLILNFIKNNKNYLELNFLKENPQVISTITNGILLSEEFVKEYFSYKFTWMLISLDTIKSELDHRELTQNQIDKIISSISTIPEESKGRVWMRNTISRETVYDLKNYIDTFYGLGIKNIIIHPLVLDSMAGFISWPEEEWNLLHNTLMDSLNEYNDLQISFSEGVGKKGENNCMIGSDMIAIDGSGDFSGCYFFTNQKANGADITILGNVFNDTIYVDRYKQFQKEFQKMFDEEEQCKSCDYKQKCYQCPAGNLDTGSRMFRPDDMCQKIVKLYNDLQDDVTRKQYSIKYENMLKLVEEKGEEDIFVNIGLYTLFVMLTGNYTTPNCEHKIDNLSSNNIFAIWKDVFDGKLIVNTNSFDEFIQSLPSDYNKNINIKELYEFLLEYLNIPSKASKKVLSLDIQTRVGYFVLVQLLSFSNRGKGNTLSENILTNEP